MERFLGDFQRAAVIVDQVLKLGVVPKERVLSRLHEFVPLLHGPDFGNIRHQIPYPFVDTSGGLLKGNGML